MRVVQPKATKQDEREASQVPNSLKATVTLVRDSRQLGHCKVFTTSDWKPKNSSSLVVQPLAMLPNEKAHNCGRYSCIVRKSHTQYVYRAAFAGSVAEFVTEIEPLPVTHLL